MLEFIKNKKAILLFAIVALGLFLRFANVWNNPPALHADEADTGYTALSLIKTLHDPYGNFLPFHFQGQANIYRSPLYTYSVIPAIYVFGLNPLSERLPSVLFGTLLIVVLYLLSQHLFKKSEISLIVAFLAAINPWLILISRTGLEISLCALLVTSGIYFFIKSGRNINFIISGVLFGLSLFSYHAAKIFVPVILVFLIYFCFKEFKRLKAGALIGTIFFLFFLAGMLYLEIFSKGAAEYSNVTIFDNNKASEIVNAQRTRTLAPLGISSVFSNKIVFYFREFSDHFIAPISINYLFVNGENSLDKGFGNYGQFHLFELPFIFAGVVLMFKKNRKVFYLITVWVLTGLIPGSITINGYYSYRDVLIAPALILLSGFGGYYFLLQILRKQAFLCVLYLIFCAVLIANFLYILFFAYPVYSRDWWAYTQKEALSYINQQRGKYVNFYIHGGMDWNILYAFYNKVAPKDFQSSIRNKMQLKNGVIYRLNGINFGYVVWEGVNKLSDLQYEKNSLLVAPGSFFPNEQPLKLFYSVDGVHVDIKAFKLE